MLHAPLPRCMCHNAGYGDTVTCNVWPKIWIALLKISDLPGGRITKRNEKNCPQVNFYISLLKSQYNNNTMLATTVGITSYLFFHLFPLFYTFLGPLFSPIKGTSIASRSLHIIASCRSIYSVQTTKNVLVCTYQDVRLQFPPTSLYMYTLYTLWQIKLLSSCVF